MAAGTAHNLEDIADQLKAMRFRRKVFGGVDEADVWRQLEELEKSYESVLAAQQNHFNGRLQEAYDENAWLQGELDRAKAEVRRLRGEIHSHPAGKDPAP